MRAFNVTVLGLVLLVGCVADSPAEGWDGNNNNGQSELDASNNHDRDVPTPVQDADPETGPDVAPDLPNDTGPHPQDVIADSNHPDSGPDVVADTRPEDARDDPPPEDPCRPLGNVAYRSLSTVGETTDRVPHEHADLNIKLRGWGPTGGSLDLVDYDGGTDNRAPKIYTLLSDDRRPGFVSNYRVNQWDWGCNCRSEPISDWDVTMIGFATTPGEALEAPRSGYDIGEGLTARVLYLDEDAITLKYTREDNVVIGYAMHIVGVCIEPALRELYQSNHQAGRRELPALGNNQPFGRARGSEVLVTIRDCGAFMDPRSRKDWW